MNTFDFIGRISIPSDRQNFIKRTNNNKKFIKLLVKQNENNSGYAYMYGDTLSSGAIIVVSNRTKRKFLVPFEKRFDKDILNSVSYVSKYYIEYNHKKIQFIWKDDFMDYLYELINSLSENTIYKVSGDYSISYNNGKLYNNFNIKSVTVDNSLRPELTLKLDLFYNYQSLDERDKRNKFILNAYIQQYVYANKRMEYFPIQVQFVTNRFDFKNATHIDLIKHRKANLLPDKSEGYVKATWEAQYVRGAQLILPPLETLPKDIQFEIINAGRDIKEYMHNVIGKAEEFICLTRPDNTLNKDGKAYISISCTDNEFKSQINRQFIEDNYESIDKIAKYDAEKNPFN